MNRKNIFISIMTSSKTVVPIYILVYNDKYTFGLAKHIGNRQIDDDDFWKFTRLDYELSYRQDPVY